LCGEVTVRDWRLWHWFDGLILIWVNIVDSNEVVKRGPVCFDLFVRALSSYGVQRVSIWETGNASDCPEASLV